MGKLQRFLCSLSSSVPSVAKTAVQKPEPATQIRNHPPTRLGHDSGGDKRDNPQRCSAATLDLCWQRDDKPARGWHTVEVCDVLETGHVLAIENLMCFERCRLAIINAWRVDTYGINTSVVYEPLGCCWCDAGEVLFILLAERYERGSLLRNVFPVLTTTRITRKPRRKTYDGPFHSIVGHGP